MAFTCSIHASRSESVSSSPVSSLHSSILDRLRLARHSASNHGVSSPHLRRRLIIRQCLMNNSDISLLYKSASSSTDKSANASGLIPFPEKFWGIQISSILQRPNSWHGGPSLPDRTMIAHSWFGGPVTYCCRYSLFHSYFFVCFL